MVNRSSATILLNWFVSPSLHLCSWAFLFSSCHHFKEKQCPLQSFLRHFNEFNTCYYNWTIYIQSNWIKQDIHMVNPTHFNIQLLDTSKDSHFTELLCIQNFLLFYCSTFQDKILTSTTFSHRKSSSANIILFLVFQIIHIVANQTAAISFVQSLFLLPSNLQVGQGDHHLLQP